ncbi:unnamed protein product [Cyprideis torosa]|uniref:Uncharacterized protein n=1 Tax=Cyprideis torosa TaxID=163714 RepID=A0A7R8ZRC0_9CRUS|nr:unnamed protein product [Cyprideis torosa]CAG0903306.1 unnamed protein product [Cyprideis torosa]
MASESQKEASALENQSPDEVLHFTKVEDSEVSCDPNDFTGSTEAMPLRDVTLGSMDSNNETCDVPDQIEASEDDGTGQKGKNSAGQRQQKKRSTCAVCGKSLSSKQNLQFHELTHTGEKPFACRICGKSFKRSSNLSAHKICEKGFRSKSGFRYHEKKHHEGTESVCALCGEPFRLVDDLEKHLKICGKGFRSRSGLRYHEKKHPEENKSVCALCGEPFLLVDDLKKHLKWHIQVLVDYTESDPVHRLFCFERIFVVVCYMSFFLSENESRVLPVCKFSEQLNGAFLSSLMASTLRNQRSLC